MKEAETAVQGLMSFQMDRDLHKQPYNPGNEHVNIVEELFESVGFNVPKENRKELLIAWEKFSKEVTEAGIVEDSKEEISTHEQIDAYGDIIVFAVGAITKLGYDPEKVLLEIGKEINSRIGIMVDGKFEKDLSKEAQSNWYKANFQWCSLMGAEKQRERRKAFHAVKGYMGNEEEVERWVKNLS